MFFKNSRYQKLPSAVTLDGRGNRFKSVSPRPAPESAGTFLHTLRDGDRLDHLAYKYYKAPKKWWRIMDANPDFLSPLDLLGTGVVKSVRIALQYDDEAGEPPWSQLAARLAALIGVDSFRLAENVRLSEATQSAQGETIPVATQSHERSVLVNYNSLTITVNELTAAVNAAGFTAGRAESIGRTGRRIIIAPDGPA
ncbi:MAG: hypothetical protein HY885_16485 [Deltaproteobacteria bacterium]|nr:hypothetical protein [Deltaproteobacteria bacterium]